MERLLNADSGGLEVLVREFSTRSYVNDALLFASPSLHSKMQKWLSGDGGFNNICESVARYLIRMSYRATPFGTFSCVSSWNPGQYPVGIPLLPSAAGLRKSVDLDSTVIQRLGLWVSSKERSLIQFHPNDTLVDLGEEYSYLSSAIAKSNRPTPYKKVIVEKSPYLCIALEAAGLGATLAEIHDCLTQHFAGDSSDEVWGFVGDLVDQQILVSDNLHRLITSDALHSLEEQLPEASGLRSFLLDLRREVASISGDCCGNTASSLGRIRTAVTEFVKTDDIRSIVKVDLCGEVKRVVPTHCNDFAKSLRCLETALSEACTIRRSTSLKGFCTRFESRFGSAELPLSYVADILDSLGFDRRVVQAPLAKAVLGTAKRSTRGTAANPSHDPLGLAGLALKGDLYIDATSLLSGRKDPLASEVSDLLVNASVWEGRKVDDSGAAAKVLEVRGVSVGDPGRVYGRFTNSLPSLREYVEARAGRRGRVPVELVHLPKVNLGNILSRADIGSLQLGIRANVPNDRAIEISDLMVRVRAGEVLLRSKRLNQDIELRMSNAHAFNSSPSIPLYRFLACVANQGFEIGLPRLRSLAPNAPFVPGVSHRGIILSRATWRLTNAECDLLRRVSRKDARAYIAKLRSQNNWPNPIALQISDRVAPFNLDRDWMVDELIGELGKLNGADFVEVYPRNLQPALLSEQGRHFHELQLPLFRDAIRRDALTSVEPVAVKDVVRPAWGEWAFLRIYVEASNQDSTILAIVPVLRSAASRGEIDQFFFIRYNDEGGEHLRLRVKTEGGSAAGATWRLLADTFERLALVGMIHSVNSDSYVREIERYGGEHNCSVCEEIFFHDTLIASEVAFSSPDESLMWKLCALLMDEMLGALGVESIEEKLSFARKASSNFQRELQIGERERSRIRGVFNLLPSSYNDFLNIRISQSHLLTEHAASIIGCWRRISTENLMAGDLYRMRWSLIHMRVNRLLNSGARTEEAILWDLLRRLYDREVAKGRKHITKIDI
ncbi:lantibiotic dehydratase [Xanthomonas translucens]|uniref:lantibiotic dehydratase n=1 Tax=Xanthomonas campestris pv. translucens TaxID=343 RepID=UPI0022A95A6E|nr:lantibiotic dehydratase [Xanthomonas translucens]